MSQQIFSQNGKQSFDATQADDIYEMEVSVWKRLTLLFFVPHHKLCLS